MFEIVSDRHGIHPVLINARPLIFSDVEASVRPPEDLCWCMTAKESEIPPICLIFDTSLPASI